MCLERLHKHLFLGDLLEYEPSALTICYRMDIYNINNLFSYELSTHANCSQTSLMHTAPKKINIKN